MINSVVKVLRGITRLRGNTDHTLIGNVSDGIKTVIQGGNYPYYQADVELVNGVKRIKTDSTVQVEQIFGQDDYADTWFKISQAGLAGDTIRIQIAGYTDPTSPYEMSVPAVDYTYTLLAGDAGQEIQLRDNLIAALNNNATFSLAWKATAIKDNPIIHISAKPIAEIGERPISGDFDVTSTGTTIVYKYHDKIIRRGKANSRQRDPRDRRLVTVGISGEVTAVPSAAGDAVIQTASNVTYLEDMNKDGSVAPIDYFIYPDPVYDTYIEELVFYGYAGSIKFGQFLSLASALTNGILITYKTDNKLVTRRLIKTTDDLYQEFALGEGQGFSMFVQPSTTAFKAVYSISGTMPLRKQGTFGVGNDDYIRVRIQDNLLAISKLKMLVNGFHKEV